VKRNLAVVLVALVAVLTAVAVPNAAIGAPADLPDAAYSHNVCGPPAAGTAACHAKVVDSDAGGPGRAPTPQVSASPAGLTVTDIRTAYGFAPTGGAGKTIAIVDAYDNPTAGADLSTFSTAMGITDCPAGCFTKVNQSGVASPLPSVNQGWALEIALDVQWAHAVAPNANILLVEANSNSYTDLFAAVDRAALMGANYISMSWGSPEFSGETAYDSHFTAPGVSYFVSAGDNGTPAEYPSSSPNVLSIGGTKLTFNAGKTALLSETGWTDGGGGCSSYESKVAAQTYPVNLCSVGVRATPDISLDADPASGVSVYMGSSYTGAPGWFTVGGTSASAPMIAGRAALTGGPVNASTIYALTAASVRDITVGNNGAACRTGFDLCSGVGSWADNAASVPATTTTTTTVAPTVNVHVGVPTYAQTPNRKGFTVTVSILRDSNNSGVSGATVTVQIKRNGVNYASGTGTTASNGTVKFQVANASSGQYTTAVTTLAPSSLAWNGQTPPVTYTKP
jgi:hypothetical protein